MKSHILVIDDEPLYFDIVKDSLESNTYELKYAATVKDAFSQVEIQKPDLILLDWNLKRNQSGIDVLEKIKREPKYRGIPVIMMTSNKAEDYQLKGISQRSLHSLDDQPKAQTFF